MTERAKRAAAELKRRGWNTAHDGSTLEDLEAAIAAAVGSVDCRTCGYWRGPGDGCGHLLLCKAGELHAATVPVQCWPRKE